MAGKRNGLGKGLDSLTSKANLVNKYNSGVKTEEVIPEKQDNKKKK